MELKYLLLFLFALATSDSICQEGSYLSELWESGFDLEITNGDQLDTVKLKDIIKGKNPNAILIDHLGDTISYDELKGNVILLDFWFLKCKPCIAEITGFDILASKYKDKDLKILSFTFDEYEEVNAKLLSKREFKFPIMTNTRLMGKIIYPLKILIDKNGNWQHVKSYGSQANDAHVKLVEEFTPLIDKWIYK